MDNHKEQAERIVAAVLKKVHSGEVSPMPKWRLQLYVVGRYALGVLALGVFVALAAVLLRQIVPATPFFIAAATCASAAAMTALIFAAAFAVSVYACRYANAGACKGKPWSSAAVALLMLVTTAVAADISLRQSTFAAAPVRDSAVGLCESVARAAD